MVRKFKLINADGKEYDLMAKKSFFHLPSGLGFQYAFGAESIGYDFLQTSKNLEQKVITGEMVFMGDDPYKEYQTFVSFCSKNPLKMEYRPTEKSYYINVSVQKIQKGEKEVNRLICPVDFIAWGTWYEPSVVSSAENEKESGKIYPYTYPYQYTENAMGVAKIKNNGDIPSYCKIHIMGPCNNPTWALEQGGEVLVRGRVLATIPRGNKLVVNSSPAEMEIAEYTTNNQFVRNLYQSSDFATGRFVIVPTGEIRISFSHDGSEIIKAFAEVSILAESV